MKRVVNGVECDTYAYIDDKETGETVKFYLTHRANYNIIVYLFADQKPFPAPAGATIECCATTSRQDVHTPKTTFGCSRGTNGEITVPIPEGLRTPSILFCEINVSGTGEDNHPYRFRAADFRVAIMP